MEKLRGLSILIAEDNLVSQEYVKSLLQAEGVEVTVVEDGQQAVKAVSNRKFDVILMDLNMPVLSGISAAKQIKNQLKINTPIIALAGSESEQDVADAKQAGIKRFIAKPMSLDHLTAIIMMELSEENNKEESTQVEQATDHAHGALYSLEKLEKMSRGKTEFIDRMVALFVAEIPSSIAQINEDLASGRYDRIKAVVHRMKPSIKMMSISSIESDIQLLEDLAGAERSLDQIPSLVDRITTVCHQVVEDLGK